MSIELTVYFTEDDSVTDSSVCELVRSIDLIQDPEAKSYAAGCLSALIYGYAVKNEDIPLSAITKFFEETATKYPIPWDVYYKEEEEKY